MDVSKDFVNCLIMDLKKPEINKIDRAKFIQDCLDKLDSKRISIREFARRTGLNKSTLEDWLLWNRITAEQVERLKNSGLNETQIYHQLRNNKDKTAHTIVEEIETKKLNEFETQLETFIKFIHANIGKVKPEPTALEKVKQLQKEINHLLMYLEKP